MTEVQETQETVEEEVANPYNMKKDYDIEDEQVFESADGVYYDKPKKKATRKSTPSDDNYKKRYDDLKKHYDNKINEFKQKEKELQAQSRMQQRVEQTVRHEERQEAESQPARKTEVTRTPTPTLAQREAKVARKEAEMSLQKAHPDFAEIRESTEFHTWAKSQPKVIQDWVYNNPNDVSLAVKAIDIYKSETGITSSRTTGGSQSRPSGSAADMVSTKTKTVDAGEPRIWSQREIAALSMDQYDKYEEEIDLAISEGRVVA
jgi:hypothetical protein